MMIRRFELFKVRDGASSETLERFERTFRAVGDFIPVVFESDMGRNRLSDTPTHVWEHSLVSHEEYDRLYMNHPYHACVLDRFLLPGNPERITQRSHRGGMFIYETDDWDPSRNHGLKRLVIFRTHEQVESERLAAFESDLRATPAPGMRLSSLGRNQVPLPTWRGPSWTHVWEQAFEDEAALRAYLSGASEAAALERAGWQPGPDSLVAEGFVAEYWKE